MNVYAESSAVLSWLMREPDGAAVISCLERASLCTASDLTRVEVLRGLLRAYISGAISAIEWAEAKRQFAEQTSSWVWVELDRSVLSRAEEPFPVEPVRTLDALHLASALEIAPDLRVAVLSLDHRVRANATALGLTILPERTKLAS